MGIRYFAYPVSPRQIEQAKRCPRGCFDGADAWEHWQPGDEPTLDLDKCYPELQWLLGGSPPRASYALVEGAAGYTWHGWDSFRRTLEPDQVKAIADDLDQLLSSPAELESIGCRFDGEDCATGNLALAHDFVSRVADAGYGVHYRIG